MPCGVFFGFSALVIRALGCLPGAEGIYVMSGTSTAAPAPLSMLALRGARAVGIAVSVVRCVTWISAGPPAGWPEGRASCLRRIADHLPRRLPAMPSPCPTPAVRRRPILEAIRSDLDGRW